MPGSYRATPPSPVAQTDNENMIHEACAVEAGIKCCLKLDLSPAPIVMGRQSAAWDHLHCHPVSAIYMVGLWARESEQTRYELWKVVDETRFLPYSYIRGRLIRQFIVENDLSPAQEKKEEEALRKGVRDLPAEMFRTHVAHRWDELQRIQPSDDALDDSRYVDGAIERVAREFCNDEDAGFETIRWTEYRSYKIQTRWIRIRLS